MKGARLSLLQPTVCSASHCIRKCVVLLIVDLYCLYRTPLTLDFARIIEQTDCIEKVMALLLKRGASLLHVDAHTDFARLIEQIAMRK
jgi:hypothetical protein